MTSPKPAKYLDIEQQLGEPLAPLVANRRAAGVSWRLIAIEITDKTGIDIAGETLRVWHEGIQPVAGRAS